GKKGAAFVAALFISFSAHALDRAALDKLANGDNDEKVEAIGALVAEGDPAAIGVLLKFADGEVDLGGKKVEVIVNNRLRSRVADALAALRLLSPDRAARFAAAKELAGGADAAMLPLVKTALDNEGDAEIRPLLERAEASMEMKTKDKPRRLCTIRKLGDTASPNSKTLLTEAA